MQQKPEPIVLLTTVDDSNTAQQLAHRLVEQGLAACVSLQAPVESVYRWEGKVQQAAEIPLIIKTDARYLKPIEDVFKQHHPYEVPEFIATTINYGSNDYLNWLEQCLS